VGARALRLELGASLRAPTRANRWPCR